MHADDFRRAQDLVLDRYGVQANSRFIDVPVCKGQAHVLVTGEGPPVIMANGIGTPAAMFAPLMAQLPGFTMYGVDLPGFGLTNAPADFCQNMRLNAVQFFHEVLDAINLDQAAFIANSLGSLWTSWFALANPERVASIVHVGCPAIILETSAPLPMRLLSVPMLSRLMMKLQPPSPKQVDQLSKMVGEHPLAPEVAELILATEKLPGFKSMFHPTLNKLVRPRGANPEMTLSAQQLTQIHQPVLFIWGDKDPFGSVSIGQRAVEIMPNAELHVVDGGHAPWLRSTDTVARLTVEFLQEHISNPQRTTAD